MPLKHVSPKVGMHVQQLWIQCFTNLIVSYFPVFTTFSAINRPNRKVNGIPIDTIFHRTVCTMDHSRYVPQSIHTWTVHSTDTVCGTEYDCIGYSIRGPPGTLRIPQINYGLVVTSLYPACVLAGACLIILLYYIHVIVQMANNRGYPEQIWLINLRRHSPAFGSVVTNNIIVCDNTRQHACKKYVCFSAFCIPSVKSCKWAIVQKMYLRTEFSPIF
jgi:hypothetical protein